jgi:cytochrome b
MGAMVWKALAAGAAVAAGAVANKSVTAIWSKTGKDQNIDPQNPHTPLGEALALAVISALAAAVAKTVLTRKAAQYYENSAGHLPAPLQAREEARA